ncbi:two-component response regulator-like PRR95 [Typha latifolia]|uniref:two-component response regulator-like PRR95 n=1 Tax=Typha latifolia TaxID=4733 RepID=UPI003C2DC04A
MDEREGAEMEMEMMMEEESGGLRWEKVLPRTPVRVLLVEGDDSTRQIIAALLRKCSYKVAAVSDGLKAWETLKEKPNSIDLVLTEMELPLMSGFGLLATIMDHEICKKIPIIMMSPHDSVSMVFKCMLKGAADFLVKPIRKNELRNLWQHVWRRQIANGELGGTNGHQDVDNSKRAVRLREKEKLPSESLSCVQKNKECSPQGSDAQSSCTRSDLEAESKHGQNILEHERIESRDPSPVNHVMAQNGERHIQLGNSISMHERGVEATGNEDLIARGYPDHNDLVDETYYQKYYQGVPPKQIPDFLQVIDNQPKQDALNNGDAFRNNSRENEIKRISTPLAQMDISLRNVEYCYFKKQENNQRNFLNHSNSSAFSLYINKTAVAVTSGNANDGPGCTRSAPSIDFEDTRTNGIRVPLPIQDGTSIECTPTRATPYPIPVRDVSSDQLNSRNNEVMQSLFYPHTTQPLWNHNPSVRREETTPQNSSYSSESNKFNCIKVNNAIDQTITSPSRRSEQSQDETTDVFHEQGNALSIIGESGSSSACTGDRIQLSNGTAGMTGCITSIHRYIATAENATRDGVFSYEVPISTNFHSASPRELALSKFRLKRKDRCFEKKVRYQSRKILAEKRPRIKGQFVRQ